MANKSHQEHFEDAAYELAEQAGKIKEKHLLSNQEMRDVLDILMTEFRDGPDPVADDLARSVKQ